MVKLRCLALPSDIGQSGASWGQAVRGQAVREGDHGPNGRGNRGLMGMLGKDIGMLRGTTPSLPRHH
eukprot:2850535-Alexandrium_andersonii.AAC.2